MAQIISRGRNRWLVRVFLGRDEQTGKPVFRNRTLTGGKKDADAWAIEAERERDSLGTGARAAVTVTVDSLLDGIVRDYQENGKRLDWCKMVVDVHLRPAFGKLAASKVTTATVRAYMDARHALGRANGTINRELALLRRAYNLGLRATPPRIARTPFMPRLKEDNVRKGFFEHEEYLAMLREVPEYLRPVLAFAYHTGCRRGEILALQWEQIDLGERIVRLEVGETKNDQGRIIPMAPELFEMLAMQKARRDQEYPACSWVFFNDGEPIRNFRNAWEAACQRAGLWIGDEETGHPTKLFHDLRRTGVRNLVRAGVPEAVAMRISGHKTRAIFDRYNIVTESDLKDAARKLGEYLSRRRNETEQEQAGGKSHTIVTLAARETVN